MKMEKLNKKGRTYIKGRPLGNDARQLVIDEMLQNGGDVFSGYFPGKLRDVAAKFKISNSTVTNIWSNAVRTGNVNPAQKKGGNPSHLSEDDLKLIETLVMSNPTITQKEILHTLEEFGDIFGGTSISAISNALRNRMPSGKEYSHKKCLTTAQERFTPNNMIYTQLFINYLHSKDPYKLKFFDEAGLKVPDGFKRSHGFAPVGERCIEIIRYHESPNITLNLLAGLDGIKYANFVDGSSDTIDFLQFWEEAARAGDVETGRPVLEVGDVIVMDNCPTHHHLGGQILNDFLHEELGIELVYTPTYSPDFNPVEFVFSKMRSEMRYNFADIVAENLKLSALEALQTVSASDMEGYYRATSYI